MPDFSRYLALDYWREHALRTGYVIWGVVLFLIFLMGGFPYDRVLSDLMGPMGLRLTYAEQRSRFPFGAVLDDVRLMSLGQGSQLPLLQSNTIDLAPGLLTLIGQPSLWLRADAYGGLVDATVRRSGSSLAIAFNLDAVNLERYHTPSLMGATISGKLSGEGKLLLGGQDFARGGSGTVNIDLSDFVLNISKGFAPVRFARLKGRLSLGSGLLKIEALDGSGQDLALHAAGTVTIGATAASTTVRLTFNLKPSAAGQTKLAFLLGFLPHPPRAGSYTLRGPLTAPSLS